MRSRSKPRVLMDHIKSLAKNHKMTLVLGSCDGVYIGFTEVMRNGQHLSNHSFVGIVVCLQVNHGYRFHF